MQRDSTLNGKPWGETFQDPWPGATDTEPLGNTPVFAALQTKNNKSWDIWFRKSNEVTEHIGQAMELRRREQAKQ